MCNIKPFLVFASPRSGSSVLMSIIKIYSEEKFITGYDTDEYFDVHDHILIGNKLVKNTKGINIENVDLEILNRIHLINKNKSIKVLSNQITYNVFDYVKDKYKIILIERKNKYDQLLSWIIALHTNVWNVKIEDDTERPAKFTAELKRIDRFFELQHQYQKWKIEFDETIVIHYEDLDHNDNFKKIVEQIGFEYDNRNIWGSPKKLYSILEKEEMIINLDEIKLEFKKRMNE